MFQTRLTIYLRFFKDTLFFFEIENRDANDIKEKMNILSLAFKINLQPLVF